LTHMSVSVAYLTLNEKLIRFRRGDGCVILEPIIL
jgi:hypothetical protein